MFNSSFFQPQFDVNYSSIESVILNDSDHRPRCGAPPTTLASLYSSSPSSLPTFSPTVDSTSINDYTMLIVVISASAFCCLLGLVQVICNKIHSKNSVASSVQVGPRVFPDVECTEFNVRKCNGQIVQY